MMGGQAGWIYDESLSLLKEMGHISRLDRLLAEENIDDRMTRIDVRSSGLETVDAVHCLLDRKRTFALLEAVERYARPGDVVVEAGLGTGILAAMAAGMGAEVYGIEINDETLALAEKLCGALAGKGFFQPENLHLIGADASAWQPERPVDLIISENIYAGMFYEMQIPIVNNLLQYRSSRCRSLPEALESFVILAEVKGPEQKGHGQSFSPSDAEGRIYQWRELSEPVLYDQVDFRRRNDARCSADLKLRATGSGSVNSLLIYSPVKVAEGIVLRRQDMIFMGEDIFVVIDPPLAVDGGCLIRLRMDYERGGKPESGSYRLERLN